MTVPSSPFATTKQIAYLLLNLFPGTGINQSDPDFTSSTLPSLTTVSSIRTMRSAVLMMEFSNVGYKIPFEALSGESWPDHQTNFLAMLEALGVAGDLANSLKPSPARGSSAGPSGNIYTTAFQDWQKVIRESGGGLRAGYFIGTKAEQWMSVPRAPTTDYTARWPNNYADPAKFGLLLDNLKLLEDQFEDIAKRNLNWDYVYLLR